MPAFAKRGDARMTAPQISQPMGSITVLGVYPYSFVTGTDGYLWVNWWSGKAGWKWSDQKQPPGVKLGTAMGVVLVDSKRPYVFVKGDDGNLWVNAWSGTAWAWVKQAPPPGVTLVSSMGACTVDHENPWVHVKGIDGKVWVSSWTGTTATWWNQKPPPGGLTLVAPMGVVMIYNHGPPNFFARLSDGNLWVLRLSVSGGLYEWVNRSRPESDVTVETSMGAVRTGGGLSKVFVKGSDGNLWVNEPSGATWVWTNLETPPGGVALETPMGAATTDFALPYVFVKGSDGNLWLNWWSGKTWAWVNRGRPKELTLDASNGAIVVDGTRPYCFVQIGTDLWVNWWSGTAWAWAKQT
jgi:hypothetical protein